MSLEATIARAVSLKSINHISSRIRDSSSDSIKKLLSFEQLEEVSSNEEYQQEQQQQQENRTIVQQVLDKKYIFPSSGQEAQQQQQHQQQANNSNPFSPHNNSNSNYTRSNSCRINSYRCPSVRSTPSEPSPCHLLVEQIIYTVGELEHTLIEDHQNDFELRMALERQNEKVHDLRTSLVQEKQRNQRLVHLIRGVDSSSSTDEETQQQHHQQQLNGVSVSASYINGNRWQSRSSMNAFESISPLLMQQRYDELSMSHKQCRKQLVKKEKLLTQARVEKEDLQGRYDNLVDEYRDVQKRFEELCCRYLKLQAKKNQEIQKLREALSCASDCVISAQQVMEEHEHQTNLACHQEFRQNLLLFIKALRLCEWVHSARRGSRSRR